MTTSPTSLTSFHEKKDAVARALAEIAALAARVGARSLGARVERDLVRKLEEDRFHLVVVGEFNHGKTTFVNALLGAEVLPTGVTPTTAAIHHLRDAAEPTATVVRASGAREVIPFADVRRFAVGGPEGASDDVDYVEIGHPAPLLAERVLLVDTPGVNDLSLQRADITYSYIPRADAVLFLLDAGQILKESERVFLQEKLLKASRDKIVFVVTKWDILSSDERDEALRYAKDQLARLVKDPVVFPVSAEAALAGDRAGSGMDELVGWLTRYLAEQRGRILLGNALGEGLIAAQLLAKGVDARRRGLAMQAEEIDRRIALLEKDLAGQAGTIEQRRARIREEVRGIKVGAQKDLARVVDDVARQLPGVIDAARGDELKKYLPAFLEETFRKWAESESREIAAALEALAEKTVALVREDAHDAARRVAEAMGGDVKPLEVKVDTFGYDIGVVALVTVGFGVLFANALVGGLLIAAAPVLALFFRDKVEAEYKRRAKELAPEVLRATAAKVGPKMDAMIDDFAGKLDAYVVGAGEELHREVLEVLHATRAARARGADEERLAREELERDAGALVAAEARLCGLRAEVSAGADDRAGAAAASAPQAASAP